MQTYLLKLARSGEEGEKVFVILESGTRFHTTKVIIHSKAFGGVSKRTMQLDDLAHDV